MRLRLSMVSALKTVGAAIGGGWLQVGGDGGAGLGGHFVGGVMCSLCKESE